MTTIKVSESIIKEKARFLEANGAKLFLARNERINGSKNTMGEMLLGVLLTDKPLRSCSSYDELQSVLSQAQCGTPAIEPTANYPLQVLFYLVNYVNNTFGDEEKTAKVLREKLRRYQKHLDNRITNCNLVYVDFREDQKMLYHK